MRLLLGVLSITIIFAYANGQLTLSANCMNAFYQAALSQANMWRMSHNSPALKTDASLNASSSAYANKLVNSVFGGSGLAGIGENILKKTTSSVLTDAYCARNIYFKFISYIKTRP